MAKELVTCTCELRMRLSNGFIVAEVVLLMDASVLRVWCIGTIIAKAMTIAPGVYAAWVKLMGDYMELAVKDLGDVNDVNVTRVNKHELKIRVN